MMTNGTKGRTAAVFSFILLLSASWFLVVNPGTGDGAIAFEADILINQDSGDAVQDNPAVVTDGRYVYVIWEDQRDGTKDLYCRVSNDSGRNFGKEVRVDDTSRTKTLADDITDQENPSAALAPNGDLYVVWEDDREGRSLTFISRSIDHGETFSENILIDDSPQGKQTNPHIDISPDSGDIYVVWEDTRNSKGYPMIFLAHTFDGISFDPSVQVSDQEAGIFCEQPRVGAGYDGYVHVVWVDDRTWDLDIYTAASNDYGASFQSSVRINRDPSNSDQEMPDIAVSETHIFVVWKDQKMTSADIYISNSTDSGRRWNTEFCVHPESTSGAQYDPRIVLDDGGNLSIAWTSSPGFADDASDIQATKLYPNGTSEIARTVNDPLSGVIQANHDIDVSPAGKMFTAWRDSRRFRTGSTIDHQQDIYFCRSTASGQVGEAPMITDISVNPEVGGVGDRFTFLFKYTDIEGDAPMNGYPKLNVTFRSGGEILYEYPRSPFNMSMRMIPIPDYDYRNGEYFIFTLEVERSLDLYFQIMVRAATGNTTLVKSEWINLPVIDDTPPTFQRVYPPGDQWHSSNIVPFVVNITDMESGVETWSISYQIYREDINEWTSWQSRGVILNNENGVVTYGTNLTMTSGAGNLVHFRARDNVGMSGYVQSPDYIVRVDVDGPDIEMISPRSGSVLRENEMRVTVNISDDGIGVDPATVEIASSVGGQNNFGTWDNISQFTEGSLAQDGNTWTVRFNITLPYGAYNFLKIRASDLLGNHMESVPFQIIVREDDQVIVNHPPGPVSSVQPRITGSIRPHITWAGADDPDGDPVHYLLRIFDSDTGDLIVDWTPIHGGITYFDPKEALTPGHTYYIEIQAVSLDDDNKEQKGPVVNSTIEVSTDANMPPDMVENFYPAATSDPRPVMRWDPVSDPEGDDVFYFLRVGTYLNGGDVLPWTSTFTDNLFVLGKDLRPGIYYVSILSSDGVDFSGVSDFTMSVGVFNPKVTLQRNSVVVYLDQQERINLTISNKGFMPDRISVKLSGEGIGRDDLTLMLSDDKVDLPAGSSRNISMVVAAADNAQVGIYLVNVTVISLDGVSLYEKQLSIRVIDPENIPNPEGVTGGGGEDEGVTDYLIWIVFAVLIIVLIGLIIAFVMLDRKQREEKVDIIREKKKSMGSPREREALSGGRKTKKKRELPPVKESE
ncbi:MAG: hypothetical protein ACMUIG_08155 [Thermoplasmatota archaeon]